jgi:hypothetical protein
MGDFLLGCVVAEFVALGLRQNSKEGRITVSDPVTKREAANKDGDTSENGIEQIEGTDSTHADEVEERPLNTQVGERLMETLEDSVCTTLLLCFVGHVVSVLFKATDGLIETLAEIEATHPTANSEH